MLKDVENARKHYLLIVCTRFLYHLRKINNRKVVVRNQ